MPMKFIRQLARIGLLNVNVCRIG